jgi:hypothetical protein
MAHWWIVRRRPDANAYSAASHTDAGANTDPRADANTYTDAESGPGMQWGPDMERNRDLYRWAARESERRHLRSQVVDSKPES